MRNEKCTNCGAYDGLHHYETDQCPFGGVEAAYGAEQLWETTTFDAGEIETKKNKGGRPPSAYPYMVHVKMPFKDKAEHQLYLAMTKNNTRSRVTAVLGEAKNA